jgi:hypothetical protein
MATTSNMFLYSLTIQPPTNVVQAVLGQFAGTKEQLIITGAGSRLALLRPDSSQGKVITVLSHDIFGIIRSLAAFRLAGSNKGEFYLAPHFLECHIVMGEGEKKSLKNAPHQSQHELPIEGHPSPFTSNVLISCCRLLDSGNRLWSDHNH